MYTCKREIFHCAYVTCGSHLFFFCFFFSNCKWLCFTCGDRFSSLWLLSCVVDQAQGEGSFRNCSSLFISAPQPLIMMISIISSPLYLCVHVCFLDCACHCNSCFCFFYFSFSHRLRCIICCFYFSIPVLQLPFFYKTKTKQKTCTRPIMTRGAGGGGGNVWLSLYFIIFFIATFLFHFPRNFSFGINWRCVQFIILAVPIASSPSIPLTAIIFGPASGK